MSQDESLIAFAAMGRQNVEIPRGACMSASESDNSATDYVAMALSPLLIMGLVGSLVFFLLEILYAGEHGGRMQWILFFYVFAAVLIARIAMQPDIASRATLYGLVAGVLVWIGLILYVEYPSGSTLANFGWLINLGLIGLIWWCAYQLTWDCTFVDEKLGASGEGILRAAGLEETQPEAEEAAGDHDSKLTWLERYQQDRKRRQEKRTPGVWVIYFSLAALPLFGLGQSLIPAEHETRRRYTFWLMLIYVGCGLGLLLTTCFLGLRMYLRRRSLRMPAGMTAIWLVLGAGLIAALLSSSAFLPRPKSETPLFQFEPVGSPQASRNRGKGGFEEEGDDGRDTGGRKDKGRQPRPRPGQDKGGKDEKDRNTRDGNERDNNMRDEKTTDVNNKDSPREQTQEADSESWKNLGLILKWIVLGILGLLVLFFVLRAFLQFCAGFSQWARNLLNSLQRFWDWLLGLFGTGHAGSDEGIVSVPEAPRLSRPFAWFRNPFEDGNAAQMSPQELARYSFMALLAWANDRGLARSAEETPLEFAARLGEQVPALDRDALKLAELYARAVYGQGLMPATSTADMERFWQSLEAASERSLSA